ncbi:hypothetical protein DFJ74DRAFT_678747 [Hyaloraphidium curvatum]|nr:hypothetical protein DFJ74DRAFT_678747 [Hyaloraphidium curvatum]
MHAGFPSSALARCGRIAGILSACLSRDPEMRWAHHVVLPPLYTVGRITLGALAGMRTSPAFEGDRERGEREGRIAEAEGWVRLVGVCLGRMGRIYGLLRGFSRLLPRGWRTDLQGSQRGSSRSCLQRTCATPACSPTRNLPHATRRRRTTARRWRYRTNPSTPRRTGARRSSSWTWRCPRPAARCRGCGGPGRGRMWGAWGRMRSVGMGGRGGGRGGGGEVAGGAGGAGKAVDLCLDKGIEAPSQIEIMHPS